MPLETEKIPIPDVHESSQAQTSAMHDSEFCWGLLGGLLSLFGVACLGCYGSLLLTRSGEFGIETLKALSRI